MDSALTQGVGVTMIVFSAFVALAVFVALSCARPAGVAAADHAADAYATAPSSSSSSGKRRPLGAGYARLLEDDHAAAAAASTSSSAPTGAGADAGAQQQDAARVVVDAAPWLASPRGCGCCGCLRLPASAATGPARRTLVLRWTLFVLFFACAFVAGLLALTPAQAPGSGAGLPLNEPGGLPLVRVYKKKLMRMLAREPAVFDLSLFFGFVMLLCALLLFNLVRPGSSLFPVLHQPIQCFARSVRVRACSVCVRCVCGCVWVGLRCGGEGCVALRFRCGRSQAFR